MNSSRLRQRLGSIAVIAATLAGTVIISALFAAPANAAVPGLQDVSAVSASNSISPKSVTTPCPVGKRVVGTGAEITGGAGDVVIDDLRPSLTNVLATGDENHIAPAGNWSIRSYAICANPLPGLQIVSAVTATNSVSPKSVTATCPVGKRVVGTGAEITGALGEVVIDDLQPSATTVLATGDENHAAFAGNWSIRSYAICANPLPGLQIVSAVTASNSNSPKSVFATCPVGKGVLGTGAVITGGLGDVGLDDLRPTLTNVLATGDEDHAAVTRNWSIRGYAICATA